ncbi:hypothetical protein BDV06DRAFT_193298 [Aspergillus oleicola]
MFEMSRFDLETLPDLLHDLQPEMKGWHPLWGDREFWQKEIEAAAPGYPALESQGREWEHDLDNLTKIPV